MRAAEFLGESSLPQFLYHGTWRGNIDNILSDGVRSPSYWGTYEVAHSYAMQFGEAGVLIRVPLTSFDEDGLEPNEGLISSLTGAGEYIEDAVPPSTWQESLAEFGSVVYQYMLAVDPEDFIDA
jgi:hypothetical protein